MSKDPEEHQSETTKSRFLPEELHALIDALQNLHLQISSILANTRTHPSKPPGGPRDRLNIADPLKDHIAKTSAESKVPGRVSAHANTESMHPDRETPVDRSANTEQSYSEDLRENALSQYLGRKRTDHKHHSDMSEQMRANTIKYIKKALRLAKQGDAERAKVNAEFAETSMNTAIEYMSEDEYLVFKEEVERRLDTLQGKG